MAFNKEKFMEFVEEPPRISLFKPLNIHITASCSEDTFLINDVDFSELTESEQKIIIHRIISWYRKHPEELKSLLWYFLTCYYDDEYSDGTKCNRCGGNCTTHYKITL